MNKQIQHSITLTSRDFRLVQQLIYFFNETHVRNYIMKLFLEHLYPESPFSYIGTFYVKQTENTDENDFWETEHQQSFRQLVEKKISSLPTSKNVMFTVCLQYEGAKVHFVSFVYERQSSPSRLISFDSGSNLYLVGERIIVPTIYSIFQDLKWIPLSKSSKHHIGTCPKSYFSKKFGIQFSGENPLYQKLPADAFCQTWSLYFLTEWIRRHSDTKRQQGTFVRLWCQIIPCEREWYILSTFFLPLLTLQPYLFHEFHKFYPTTPIHHLRDYLLEDKWIQLKSLSRKKKRMPTL